MCTIGKLIALGLIFCAGLIVGVMLGIRDCKRTFNIPYSATGVYADGEYYFD